MSKIAVVINVEEFVHRYKDSIKNELSQFYIDINSTLVDDWFSYGFLNACSSLIMLQPSSDSRIAFTNVYNQFELELMTFVRASITEKTIQAMREFGLIRTLFTGNELYIITCNPI